VLHSIHAATGCFVELPTASDPSDLVTIRGPDTSLSQALNMVVEKVCCWFSLIYRQTRL
jgi:hypothetical protein